VISGVIPLNEIEKAGGGSDINRLGPGAFVL